MSVEEKGTVEKIEEDKRIEDIGLRPSPNKNMRGRRKSPQQKAKIIYYKSIHKSREKKKDENTAKEREAFYGLKNGRKR